MKKKFLAIVMVLSMAVAFAMTAFAASGISPEEQALLDRFTAGVKLKNGTVVKPGSKYIAAAKAALKTKDMSAADIAKVEATMDSISEQIVENNYESVSEMHGADEYSAMVAEITATANELGFKVTPGTGGSEGNPTPTVYYRDPETPNAPLVPVYGVSNAGEKGGNGGKGSVKQTGFDMTATVVFVAALVVVLSGSAVVIGKKQLLAD